MIACVVASFAFGGVWYSLLFGKAWRKEMGVAEGQKVSGAEMGKSFGLNLFGAFLMAYVLAHSVAVWHPSAWNAGSDGPPYLYGFFAGLFNWLGFIVPIQLNSIAFEKRSWKLFDSKWIRDALNNAADTSYEDDVAAVVAKLLLR